MHNQIFHIQKQKTILEQRANIIKKIREFFWSRDFLELDAPCLVRLAGQEPNIEPVPVTVTDDRKAKTNWHLHTSPEYTMKKALAAGFENIFYLGPSFRNHESLGGLHQTEFTMLEWYRASADFTALMDDTEELISSLGPELFNKLFERISMKELFAKYLDANLDEYLDLENMRKLCTQNGYTFDETDRYEELFYKIFLNKIEPHLGKDTPTIVHHYPAQMASLAKLSDQDPRYAERMEVYIQGTEIANGFSELTDATEQAARLEEEQKERELAGASIYPLDQAFLSAVLHMPPAAGIALGVDRLVMLLTGCTNINDVLVLPMSKQLEN